SSNLIWGNYFKNSPDLLNPVQMSYWDVWGAVVGISVFSSNNTIVNNEFTAQLPALSPAYNIYTGNVSYYTNMWNLTLESSAATIYYTSSISLTGSIIGGPYLGGNFWYNFNGNIPYNDNGNIAVGGDYEPLNLIDLPPANSVMLNGNTPYMMSDNALIPYLLNLGTAPPNTPMNVTLYLNMTDLNGLAAFDSSVNSPMSTQFHKFITPQQFRSKYYPSSSEISSIMNYYSGEGFKVWNYSYAPLVVVLSGNASMFEKAFGVMVYEYAFEYPGAPLSLFLTNTANPFIPASFSGEIMHVYGLSYSSDALLSSSQKTTIVMNDISPASVTSVPSNEILTPPNLENYYNVTQLHEMGMSGTGIKIGILGVGESVNISSVKQFWDTYGIHNPSVNLINLTSNGLNPYPEGFEADLDVEWSGAMAPNASIFDVMAPFNLTGIGDNAINLEFYYYLNVIDPQIISGSWAELQFHHDSGFAEIYTQIGMQAVAEGITVFLGSADSHSPLYLTVMASQYIVSVGGVSVTMNTTGAITNETGWYQPEYTWYGGPIGSGGGNSYFYSRPVYQSAERIITPSVYYNRAQPDISMPSTNLITVFSGHYYIGGGTSYATPISAGIFADIAQYENQTGIAGNGYMGWIQPALYNLGYGTLYGFQAYHQIEYIEPYPGMAGNGYIGPGWNDFAGIGTLSAFNLTMDLNVYFTVSAAISKGL
ncbi:MAG: S53 family peptidase, partial [Thermoplasmata archaeon]